MTIFIRQIRYKYENIGNGKMIAFTTQITNLVHIRFFFFCYTTEITFMIIFYTLFNDDTKESLFILFLIFSSQTFPVR